MGLGFELSEIIGGRWHWLDGAYADFAIRIALRFDVDGLTRFVRERRIDARGTIVAEGLAEGGGGGREISGSVAWRLLDQRRIPYDLFFFGDDGRRYRLRGQRDFVAYDATGSLHVLPASIYDDNDREIARAKLRFEGKSELTSLLKTFRPRVRVPALSRG